MFDFAQARTNMVDCQIHTAGVVNPKILQAFETVPRELFIPEILATSAYRDEDLVCDGRLTLLEPMIHAKMLEALNLTQDSVVLDVGCATGYSAAILSSMVSTVLAVEEDDKNLQIAEKIWDDIGTCNIVPIKSSLYEGHEKDAPYDCIVINGAVSEIPVHIVRQLKPQGYMACVLKKAGAMSGQAILVQYLGGDNFSSYPMFDAATTYLKGFEPAPAFVF